MDACMDACLRDPARKHDFDVFKTGCNRLQQERNGLSQPVALLLQRQAA